MRAAVVLFGPFIVNLTRFFHRKQKFRLLLCSHKAVEAGAVCLLLMVQGQLAGATLGHLGVAAETGTLAVFPLIGITLTRYARHLTNRWVSSLLLGACAFGADALIHGSHYPGAYTEAALTGLGAFAFSLVVSYTPIGKYIDRQAEAFHQ